MTFKALATVYKDNPPKEYAWIFNQHPSARTVDVVTDEHNKIFYILSTQKLDPLMDGAWSPLDFLTWYNNPTKENSSSAIYSFIAHTKYRIKHIKEL